MPLLYKQHVSLIINNIEIKKRYCVVKYILIEIIVMYI